MVYYSINDLEKITGVKAHTIRIWEKRYGLITPARTNTNIRYYDDDDLRKLLNISLLNRHGHRISSIIQMSPMQINAKVVQISENTTDFIGHIDNLMTSMIEINEDKFEKALSNSILKLGFEHTIANVVYPFLEKVGLLWQVGSINPIHEHFISHLIRQKLISAIDGLMPSYNEHSKLFTMFLPPNEFHELSLLFYHYIVKSMGHRVIYLGQSVPVAQISEINKIQATDYLFTTLTTATSAEAFKEFIQDLAHRFSEKIIFISGLQVREHNIDLPDNVVSVTNADHFRNELSKQLSQ